MRAILIKDKTTLDNILGGKKTWEIRGSATKIQERIGLIQSGSRRIVGICDLVGCEGPLTMAAMIANVRKHRPREKTWRKGGLPYPKTYAWVLKSARRLAKPIPYKHPAGAIIWVKLDGTAAGKCLARELGKRR